VEDIAQGIQGGKYQNEEPPDMHLEVINQWNIQGRDCLVGDIDQGIQGGQDLKGEPPDMHLEVLGQWNIQVRLKESRLLWKFYRIMAKEDAGSVDCWPRTQMTIHCTYWLSNGVVTK
jgi:hypothetical protein